MDNPLAWTQLLVIPDPAAGAGISREIPGETYERLDSVRLQLTASAAVANRFVSVDILDGDNALLARIQSTTAITAGQVARLTFLRGIGALTAGGTTEQLLPLPDIIYPAGCEFRVVVGNVDAGDQIASARFVVTRFPTGAWPPSRGAIPYRP